MSTPDDAATPPAPDRRLRVVAGTDEDGEKVVALLDSSTIRVELPSGTVPWRQQVLSIALVVLLGRLFPRLDIRCEVDTRVHADLPPGRDRLGERLAEAARNGGLPELAPTAPLITVRVGVPPSHGGAPEQGLQLHVDGGGWISYNGTQPSQLPDGPWAPVPIGPLAAACRAAGQVTNLVLESKTTTESIPPTVYASALTHSSSNAPIADEGATRSAPELDAVLVGAGSIGGAVAYALAHTPRLTGTLVVTDPQRLEDKNLDRALLATTTIAAAEPLKVDVVRDALAHHFALGVTPGLDDSISGSRAAHARRSCRSC